MSMYTAKHVGYVPRLSSNTLTLIHKRYLFHYHTGSKQRRVRKQPSNIRLDHESLGVQGKNSGGVPLGPGLGQGGGPGQLPSRRRGDGASSAGYVPSSFEKQGQGALDNANSNSNGSNRRNGHVVSPVHSSSDLPGYEEAGAGANANSNSNNNNNNAGSNNGNGSGSGGLAGGAYPNLYNNAGMSQPQQQSQQAHSSQSQSASQQHQSQQRAMQYNQQLQGPGGQGQGGHNSTSQIPVANDMSLSPSHSGPNQSMGQNQAQGSSGIPLRAAYGGSNSAAVLPTHSAHNVHASAEHSGKAQADGDNNPNRPPVRMRPQGALGAARKSRGDRQRERAEEKGQPPRLGELEERSVETVYSEGSAAEAEGSDVSLDYLEHSNATQLSSQAQGRERERERRSNTMAEEKAGYSNSRVEEKGYGDPHNNHHHNHNDRNDRNVTQAQIPSPPPLTSSDRAFAAAQAISKEHSRLQAQAQQKDQNMPSPGQGQGHNDNGPSAGAGGSRRVKKQSVLGKLRGQRGQGLDPRSSGNSGSTGNSGSSNAGNANAVAVLPQGGVSQAQKRAEARGGSLGDKGGQVSRNLF